MYRAKVFAKVEMIDHQEIDERISKCERILSSNPGSQIFAALAEAHRRRGDIDTAFQVCQKGLKSHPTYGSAHVVMAKINLDKGLYDWAETEIEKASKQGGNVHAIDLLRCEILISKGELEQAERQIRKLQKKTPDNTQLQKLLDSLKSNEQKPAEVKFPGAGIPSKLPTQKKKAPPLGSRVAMPGTSEADNGEKSRTVPSAKTMGFQVMNLSISEVLNKGLALEGVFGTLRQDSDGAVFESRWQDKGLEDKYSSAAFEAFRCVRATLDRVAFGLCQTVLVESKGVKMYFLVGNDEHFVFFSDAGTSTNRLRANLNQIWKSYEGNPRRDSSAKGV